MDNEKYCKNCGLELNPELSWDGFVVHSDGYNHCPPGFRTVAEVDLKEDV